MRLIVKVLALGSTTLTIILFAAEIFAASRNFFPIKRWVDTNKTVIREYYLMPTNQWGVVMFGDRTKPYRSFYEEKGRIHGWHWNSSARFDGDNDGKYRVDNSSFAGTAFSWGIAVTTAGARERLFYTDYYYINLYFYRNIALTIAGLSFLWFRLFPKSAISTK